jgi:hypothetical protein
MASGIEGTANEKERVFGPLFLFGSSREPDEDGDDISVRNRTRKRFRRAGAIFACRLGNREI